MKRYKTAIIGCGAIAERKHIPCAIKLPEIELVALVDKDVHRAEVLSKRFGIEKYYQDFEEVLSEVEVAIVATPNSSHAEISRECLKRGIHVLCEKPMAKSVAECESMIEASESGNAKLMVGYYMRYTSNVRIARELVMEGIIRNIKSIECSSGFVFHWPSVSNFYDSYESSGGGVLIDWGVHLIDLLYWITGQEPRFVSFRVEDRNGSKIEKDAELVLELTDGIRCRMTLSRTKKLANNLQIIAGNGWLRIYFNDFQRMEVYKTGGKVCTNGEPISIVGEKCDPYLRQLEDFIRSIVEDRPACGIDGLRTIRLVEACYKFLPHNY